MRVNYAIVFVSDMKRSIAFYRDSLGLPLKFESSEWSEFSTEGATLALHVSHRENPSGGGDVGPGEAAAGQCRAGFSVEDLDEYHTRVVGQGVRCVQEPKATFGVRIAQYVDPDGLVLSVSEETDQS